MAKVVEGWMREESQEASMTFSTRDGEYELILKGGNLKRQDARGNTTPHAPPTRHTTPIGVSAQPTGVRGGLHHPFRVHHSKKQVT